MRRARTAATVFDPTVRLSTYTFSQTPARRNRARTAPTAAQEDRAPGRLAGAPAECRAAVRECHQRLMAPLAAIVDALGAALATPEGRAVLQDDPCEPGGDPFWHELFGGAPKWDGAW